MAPKPKPDPWYQAIVDRHTPKKRVLRNCITAFLGGGLFCALAHTALFCLVEFAYIPQEDASPIVLICVIFLTALFTGIGIYDKLGQKLGAGLAVPISGFANSVAASMLEHKSEGLVLGSGCNSFKLAGAVVIFGIFSAFVVVFIGWALQLI